MVGSLRLVHFALFLSRTVSYYGVPSMPRTIHIALVSWQSYSIPPWQSIPQEIIDSHELQTITLDYRRECQHDDLVDSLTSVEPIDEGESIQALQGTNGSAAATEDQKEDCRQFLHLLRLSSDGLEINRGRTEWRKKPSRWKNK